MTYKPKVEHFTPLAESWGTYVNRADVQLYFWVHSGSEYAWPKGIKFNHKHTFGSSCVYTVSRENNYCCGWLIGSESSSVADINGAAVIVTLLVMPHDSPGFRSYSCV